MPEDTDSRPSRLSRVATDEEPSAAHRKIKLRRAASNRARRKLEHSSILTNPPKHGWRLRPPFPMLGVCVGLGEAHLIRACPNLWRARCAGRGEAAAVQLHVHTDTVHTDTLDTMHRYLLEEGGELLV